jgi:hypothetical protein
MISHVPLPETKNKREKMIKIVKTRSPESP